MDRLNIITIDGPAGAGKSTVSKELARRLEYTYLDTGAMYRAVAWAARQKRVDAKDEKALAKLCNDLKLEFQDDRILVNGEDVSSFIRTPEMDELSSAVSRFAVVREYLTGMQRKLGRQGRLVAEGRDMGTVVFPQAAYKFFLSASAGKRAKRRKMQMENQEDEMAYEEILAQIEARDLADSTRSIAPLQAAPDCIVIDSSDLTVENVLEKIVTEMKCNHSLPPP
ncbi:MAG: (d)CMP kinase [Thermodesulfobacteriota bacterium]|nr:(d)CMP kinase [Thermodesulfobacteriota bacterium]